MNPLSSRGRPTVFNGKYAKGDPFHLFYQRRLITVEGCWLWFGVAGDPGYPLFNDTAVARSVWYMIKGEIPWGHIMKRLCKTSHCANPDHFYFVEKTK